MVANGHFWMCGRHWGSFGPVLEAAVDQDYAIQITLIG